MVTVEVCIGSACYVKGSNEVVTILQELIKEKGWEDQVNVKGAFCMQVCTQGLGLRVNGKQLLGVGLHNVKEVLLQEITAARYELYSVFCERPQLPAMCASVRPRR
ncbi:MAG: (2Fe-2S) ferredoxin domain-containing protein [Holdemania filiformis]